MSGGDAPETANLKTDAALRTKILRGKKTLRDHAPGTPAVRLIRRNTRGQGHHAHLQLHSVGSRKHRLRPFKFCKTVGGSVIVPVRRTVAQQPVVIVALGVVAPADVGVLPALGR